MSLAKSFDPNVIESRWYAEWERRGYFQPYDGGSSPSYCIQLPPPNVTGTLHMGHAFQQTLMDVLIRYHRMQGAQVNWIVGTDHAGIATQVVVERQLAAQGKTRYQMGADEVTARENFVQLVWEWKRESGSTIMRQMRRLGLSANWDYASANGEHAGYFTMDDRMSHAAVEAFVRLHDQGLIYRGARLVNWDPVLMTAVSDLEVESEEEDGTLWEIRYPLLDSSDALTVATTRPETLFGDVAVAIHPADERYKKFIGKRVQLPLTDRAIPVIPDEYVDPKFGTGCVKITPAHDFNDWAVGQRHGLTPLGIFSLDAKINDAAPIGYRGLDRFQARQKILIDLKTQHLLSGEKPYKLRVPRSGRSGAIVEPMLTEQWFIKMDDLAKQGLQAVADGSVNFYPSHWSNTYRQWLENIQDWCISRQLWWGHRIPAWYDDMGNAYVGRSESEIRQKNASLIAPGTGLRRDDDVLDTWFSSALVPFTTLGWPEDTAELRKWLPSSVLVTGFDIIFFWVARMIMMTLHFTRKVPFRDVYINALVRDAEGQKMSKSKGNTLDPIDLIDGATLETLLEKSTQGLLLASHQEKIAQYIRKHYPRGIPSFGADAVRFTFTALATFSRTLNFDISRCEGYRNFCNKLWNAARFVLMNCEGKDTGLDDTLLLEYSFIDRWIADVLADTTNRTAEAFAAYRFDNAAHEIYEFAWNEYCDWYLEFAKVQLQNGNESAQRATRRTLVRILETALRLAHPIIPFITEELWQKIAPLAGKCGESIMVEPYPRQDQQKSGFDATTPVNTLKALVSACRSLRSEMGLSPAERIDAFVEDTFGQAETALLMPYLRSLAKLSKVTLVDKLPISSAPVAVVHPLRILLDVKVDVIAERGRLTKEEERLERELSKAYGKLANANFIERAPAQIIEQERRRVADNTVALEQLRSRLERLP